VGFLLHCFVGKRQQTFVSSDRHSWGDYSGFAEAFSTQEWETAPQGSLSASLPTDPLFPRWIFTSEGVTVPWMNPE